MQQRIGGNGGIQQVMFAYRMRVVTFCPNFTFKIGVKTNIEVIRKHV